MWMVEELAPPEMSLAPLPIVKVSPELTVARVTDALAALETVTLPLLLLLPSERKVAPLLKVIGWSRVMPPFNSRTPPLLMVVTVVFKVLSAVPF